MPAAVDSAAPPLRRALLSVSDKAGLAELANGLAAAGVELISTGGTARHLAGLGLAVTAVEALTGFPEIMDGRVKTLHPAVHGGILARRDIDTGVLAEQRIRPIDLVIVNLYPFRETAARPDAGDGEINEMIDIGGPALIRAAAKNRRWVTVATDPADYQEILAALPAQPAFEIRQKLAARAFAKVASYDAAVAAWLATGGEAGGLPAQLHLALDRCRELRYGENPAQRAALYTAGPPPPGSLAAAEPVQGKALSYNNYLDADAAWSLVTALGPAVACVIVKHGNPCGAARGDDAADAYRKAHAADPQSAYGGIVAFNAALDEAAARTIVERQFAEVILAPALAPGAGAVLAGKPNVRVLLVAQQAARPAREAFEIRRIGGGYLVQEPDTGSSPPRTWRPVTHRVPAAAEAADLEFAWQVARAVKSNAIVYARGGQTLGIGAGQMSRIDAARFAGLKAADQGFELGGAVMASDAFLPFPDSVEESARLGIRAIVQPGGSIRDQAVIAAADAHGIAMLFTGRRHFRH